MAEPLSEQELQKLETLAYDPGWKWLIGEADVLIVSHLVEDYRRLRAALAAAGEERGRLREDLEETQLEVARLAITPSELAAARKEGRIEGAKDAWRRAEETLTDYAAIHRNLIPEFPEHEEYREGKAEDLDLHTRLICKSRDEHLAGLEKT